VTSARTFYRQSLDIEIPAAWRRGIQGAGIAFRRSRRGACGPLFAKEEADARSG